MDKLTDIQIETTTSCPAKCLMCPLKTMKRKGGEMDSKLLYKILDEIASLAPITVHPFLNGEPFADKRQFDILDYLSKESEVEIVYFTNMECLTKEVINKLVQYTNINRINASFNGGTKKTYQKVMGLKSFKENREKILYLAQRIKDTGSEILFTVSMVNLPNTKDEVKIFKQLFPGILADDTRYKNYGKGGHHTFYRPCRRLLNHMTVLWDGRVNLCCMENEGAVILGDLKKETIKEVWERNQPMRDNMRLYHFDKLPPICSKCNIEEY